MTPDPLRSTTYMLHKGGLLVMQQVESSLTQHELTVRQYMVVATVADGTISQRDLGQRALIDQTVLVGVLDDLEARGVLRRSPDPVDRRRHQLSLTDQGATLLRAASRTVSAIERRFLNALSTDERRSLNDLLVRAITPRLPGTAGTGQASVK